MNNILVHYMKKRLVSDVAIPKGQHFRPGPVVTISREYGCPAKKIADRLSVELKKHSQQDWHWIGKEILEESAKELHLKPGIIRDLISKEDVNVVNDIVTSLSRKYYPGDLKIRKTIKDVVRSFALQGQAIIVGRGGVVVARDIPNSLHIKLVAPLEWRINDVSNRQMISLAEARKKINHIDHQRQLIMEFFEGGKVDNTIFDLVFNYMTLEEEDIISTIIRLMESKDMI